MKNSTITVLIAGASILSMVGCSHKSVKPDSEPLAVASATPKRAAPIDLSLKIAHFPLNSAVLTESGRVALAEDAKDLKENSSVNIQAQGYCDDRGSVQYNQVLGERRAAAVKAYLVSLGVSQGRITTASFGKSHPLDPRDNEQAWALNRRASFVILPISKVVVSI